jgi:Raf kinase inhibitor-like YbhB/YbcL family protein
MSLILTSPAFADGDDIPVKYTCDGDDTSPPLAWSGVPPTALSLALIVEDPDAPDPAAPQRTWVHWVLYDIPPNTDSLKEGVTSSELPPGTLEGLNDWHRTGYGGPCPPIGRHRYFFKLYALDTVLPDLGKPNRANLLLQMEGRILARAQLLGRYQRKQ